MGGDNCKPANLRLAAGQGNPLAGAALLCGSLEGEKLSHYGTLAAEAANFSSPRLHGSPHMQSPGGGHRAIPAAKCVCMCMCMHGDALRHQSHRSLHGAGTAVGLHQAGGGLPGEGTWGRGQDPAWGGGGPGGGGEGSRVTSDARGAPVRAAERCETCSLLLLPPGRQDLA